MIKNNEPLDKHTSWRVGGIAKQYFRPENLEDLSNFLKTLPITEKILFLGLGSNLLIRDGGFDGTVIHLFKTLNEISVDDDLIKIESGVTCAKIAKFCSKNKLQGGEFFAGIPGTMGGALAMNAGAFGSETWNYVEKVDLINKNGEIITRTKEEFEIGYRSVANKSHAKEWFIAGYLKFIPEAKNDETNSKIKSLLKTRNLSQPIGELSCGSVFRNPEANYAAKLIEASKLKGKRIGNAMVSTKHANFIINLGNALAKDIEDLISLVRETVLQDHGIELKLEVKIVGREGDK